MRDVINATASRLKAGGIDESEIKAELLISHVLGVKRMQLRSLSNDPSLKGLSELVERALAGEPIQYILGTVEFCGHVIRADSRALIPRPETEELVAWVLRDDDLWQKSSPRVADVCTGSGCIAVALALARPDAAITAMDISSEALDLARGNAQTLGARVEFILADLLEGAAAGSLDAVVSNPPYVTSSELKTLPCEIRGFEPLLALDGGPDGFDVIRRLARQAFRALRSGGKLFMEIGETQAGEARQILEAAGFSDVAMRKDLAGHDRMIAGAKRGVSHV